MILPLPPLLAVLDVLLATKIQSWAMKMLPVPSGCFLGATPGSQVTDVSHGIALTLEKGMDRFGRAAAAKATSRVSSI